jgi:hypothetical protein
MDRIKAIKYDDVVMQGEYAFRSVKCIAFSESEQIKTMKCASIDLNRIDMIDEKVTYSDMFVESLSMNEPLKRTEPILFDGCVFPYKTDLNFRKANCRILFRNCVFLDDFCIFGTFNEAVSFECVSFIDSNVNFQECEFGHFVFRITTLINSRVCFQQTQFWSGNVFFDNMHLYNSVVDFANSDFSQPSELLDMLCVKADDKSHIRFIMVDFDFDEIRLWRSDIECLKFIECTFNCRRFEFDCSVKTLIMQKCSNFGTISLGVIKELRDLNIVDFVNNGRVLLGSNPQIFIDAIKTNAEIVWEKGNKFRAASYIEKNAGIHDIGSFYIPSQLTKTERLCFGTFVRKLKNSMESPFNKQRELAEILLIMITKLPYVPDKLGEEIKITDKMASELFNFKADVRIEIQNRAALPDIVKIAYAHFKENVVSHVKEPLKADLLTNVKNLVQNDGDASNNKALLIHAESDTLAEFLADVFLYAIQKPNKNTESAK